MSQTEYHETGPKGGFSSAGHKWYQTVFTLRNFEACRPLDVVDMGLFRVEFSILRCTPNGESVVTNF